ncbi:hypothetical protein [Octadecabacter antarcticus]|uniref:hypothetical protein n=1 Tax=Octadecabacter antarcticus TaxID=1217908 RepID=UPI0011819094|nr:hypothetical protein [Octadecabacter antarcticus]
MSTLLNFAVWFAIRALFIVALFGGIGFLAQSTLEPATSERQELINYAVGALVASMTVWLFISLIRIVIDASSSFRQGLQEGRK